MPVRVIVFDFDGTLVESNALKQAGYRPLFPAGAQWDILLEKILHEQVAGTRRDVIRAMLRAGAPALMMADGDDPVEVLASRYDQIVTEGAVTCRERSGAGAALALLSARFPLYLLSITPEDSLQRIVARRGWSSYFRLLRGYPCDKAEQLRAFAVEEHVSCGEILMVGDSQGDRDAANLAGTDYFHMKDGMKMTALLQYLEL